MQTAEYAAAVLSFWQEFLETPNDVEAAVAGRLARQQVIYCGGKRFAVLLEEHALRTLVGTVETRSGSSTGCWRSCPCPTPRWGSSR